ncbi:MAG TPA: NAD-dependent epimerase/dehydratase family protein [Gemmatimonadaceae bacterium]|nr:NAD-dependent epimerase/dehydratase family protein [Gemmatimonadaceae bacterium]
MKAIVTGGAGFIGSHVAERLVRAGGSVLILDDLSGGFRENLPEGAQFVERSINAPLDDIFARFQPNVVFHLAAYAAEGLSHHIPVFNYTNNVTGTANVLAAAQRARVSHFVFTSSIAVYGHPADDRPFSETTPPAPIDPYGIAKLACEQHIQSALRYYGGPAYTIFRPHNVYGPRQNISDPYRNVVGIFMARALAGQPMPVFGDGEQTRSFSYIDVIAEAIVQAPHLPNGRNVTVNIGGDEPMSVRELARNIAHVMDVPDRVDFLPPRHEVKHAHCDHALARSIFADAYSRYSLQIPDGLKRMASHVRAHAVPAETECPAPIELRDGLPPSWASRLPR